jgi:ABC-type nitrate/sulfonate/bicarbonate transport system substrate-binding protein
LVIGLIKGVELMRTITKSVWNVFLTFILLMISTSVLAAQQKVTLQLFWKHQFEFAGYYAAKEKGFYKEAGLDVDIREYQAGMDVNEEVLTRRADFATASSSAVLNYQQGKPVKLLANIFKHSAHVLLSLPKAGIRTPSDLLGKRLMLTDNERNAVEFRSFFSQNGIDTRTLSFVEHTFDPMALVNGEADVMSAYITNQPFVLREMGIDYRLLDPASYGLDFYGDSLITSAQLAEQSPELAEAFRVASLKGWAYALQHPEEIIELILQGYSTAKSLEALRYEAQQTAKLILPEAYPLGSIDPARVNRIVKAMLETGVVTGIRDIEDFLLLEKKDSVTVIEFFDEPPFTINSGKAKQGYLYELLDAVLRSAGLEARYVGGFDSYDAMNEAIETGEADILTTYSVNKKRPEGSNITLSKPVLTTPFVLVARTDVANISGIESVFGKKVAVVKGYAQDGYLDKFPQVNRVHVANNTEGFEALRTGKAKYYLNNRANSEYVLSKEFATDLKIVGQLSYQDFPPLSLSFALNSNNQELVARVTKALKAMPVNEINKIRDKWLVGEESLASQLLLTDSERDFLKSNPVIRVNNDMNWPPYNFFEDNTPQGLSIDYMNLISEKLGITISYQTGPLWNEFLQQIQAKNLDVMLNIAKTKERVMSQIQ